MYAASLDHSLYALDAATLKPKWTFEAGGAITAGPVVDGSTVFAGAADDKLYAINSATGEKLWEFQAKNWFWGTPVLAGALVIGAALDHKVYGIDRTSGKLAWTAPAATSGLAAAPLLLARPDTLVAATEDGAVHFLNPQTGAERFSFKVPEATSFRGQGAAGAGSVYLVGGDGRIFAFSLDSGQTLWEYKSD